MYIITQQIKSYPTTSTALIKGRLILLSLFILLINIPVVQAFAASRNLEDGLQALSRALATVEPDTLSASSRADLMTIAGDPTHPGAYKAIKAIAGPCSSWRTKSERFIETAFMTCMAISQNPDHPDVVDAAVLLGGDLSECYDKSISRIGINRSPENVAISSLITIAMNIRHPEACNAATALRYGYWAPRMQSLWSIKEVSESSLKAIAQSYTLSQEYAHPESFEAALALWQDLEASSEGKRIARNTLRAIAQNYEHPEHYRAGFSLWESRVFIEGSVWTFFQDMWALIRGSEDIYDPEVVRDRNIGRAMLIHAIQTLDHPWRSYASKHLWHKEKDFEEGVGSDDLRREFIGWLEEEARGDRNRALALTLKRKYFPDTLEEAALVDSVPATV